jgi:DNA polymerase
MIVGEQPGDREDLEGRPFVGPAGAVLDDALCEAGIDRESVYLTNAVKHFKHTLRGKRRIHQRPNAGEIEKCRWWLDLERRIVAPDVIVALGATAARAITGRSVRVSAVRGQPVDIDDRTRAIVTVHPSYLLRLPDRSAAGEQRSLFVSDLRNAQRLARRGISTV